MAVLKDLTEITSLSTEALFYVSVGNKDYKMTYGNVVGLSGDVTLGELTLTDTLISEVADGTTPMEITSTTVVDNLNVDQVDGADLSTDGTFASNSDVLIPSEKAVKTYADTKVSLTGDETIAGVKTFSGIPAFNGGESGVSAPMTVDSTNVVTNLNADKLDGADLDTTVTLGTSDTKIPSQKAVKTYADGKVSLTGDESIADVKTFTSIPVLPASNPTTDNQASRKAYVDGFIPQMASAWVNFNGTGTVAIRDDYNVDSITDNGTGDYTVNIDVDLADANYSICSSGSTGAGIGSRLVSPWVIDASSFRIVCLQTVANDHGDFAQVFCQVFGGV